MVPLSDVRTQKVADYNDMISSVHGCSSWFRSPNEHSAPDVYMINGNYQLFSLAPDLPG